MEKTGERGKVERRVNTGTGGPDYKTYETKRDRGAKLRVRVGERGDSESTSIDNLKFFRKTKSNQNSAMEYSIHRVMCVVISEEIKILEFCV